jgi:hypothetical protein
LAYKLNNTRDKDLNGSRYWLWMIWTINLSQQKCDFNFWYKEHTIVLLFLKLTNKINVMLCLQIQNNTEKSYKWSLLVRSKILPDIDRYSSSFPVFTGLHSASVIALTNI